MIIKWDYCNYNQQSNYYGFTLMNQKRDEKLCDNTSFKGMQQTLATKSKQVVKPAKINDFLDVIRNILHNNKSKEQQIPVVSVALLCYFNGLQRKDEYLEEYAKKILKGEYMSNGEKVNAETIIYLRDKNILKDYALPNYEVIANNGKLNDDTYHLLRDAIKKTPLITDAKKNELLNSLARANYHYDDVVFRGIDELADNNSVDIDDEVVEHTSSFIETILEFLDDIF